MKLLSTLAVVTIAFTAIAAPMTASAGERERMIIQHCAARGVQTVEQMMYCSGMHVSPQMFDSCMEGGPCFPELGSRPARHFPELGGRPFPERQPPSMGPDSRIVQGIALKCGGDPWCMATSWATIEIQRCQKGIGVPGGCVGPNGEIIKHGGNILGDMQEGPSDSNDLVGKNGWLRKRLGF
jgi:hypothetical protein